MIRDGKCLLAFENRIIDDLRVESTNIPVIDQVLNSLGFEGHKVCVLTTQLCELLRVCVLATQICSADQPQTMHKQPHMAVFCLPFLYKTCNGTGLASSPSLVNLT